MARAHDRVVWEIIGSSVPGPYHIDKGISNQDAIGWHQKDQGKLPVILSVADGLGDEMFSRSAKGAQLAIDASLETCTRHIRKMGWWTKKDLRSYLLKEIITCWKQKIDEDLTSHPLSPEEVNLSTKYVQHYFSKNPGTDENKIEEFIRSFPYSTTLITVIVTPGIIHILQVGDGDIIIVKQDGSVHEIFPRDLDCGRVIPLSYPDVREASNVCKIPVRREKPLIIYVSSDGYSAGYDSMKVQFDEIVAYEFHSKIQNFEISDIQSALPDLLTDISQGSGDDTTLGIIVGDRDKIRETSLKLKTLMVVEEEIKSVVVEPENERNPDSDLYTIDESKEKSRSVHEGLG